MIGPHLSGPKTEYKFDSPENSLSVSDQHGGHDHGPGHDGSFCHVIRESHPVLNRFSAVWIVDAAHAAMDDFSHHRCASSFRSAPVAST